MSGEYQQLEDLQEFVVTRLSEWEAENPRPDISIPKAPETPKRAFIDVSEGYFVLNPTGAGQHIQITVNIPQKNIYLTLNLKEFGQLLEAGIELQSDMQQFANWHSLYGAEHRALKNSKQSWEIERQRIADEAREEFLEARAIRMGDK